MNVKEKAAVDEIAEALGMDGDVIKGIKFLDGYWVVDDVNNILYIAENETFTEEVLLLDLLSLVYVTVGDTYTMFIGTNMYFLGVETAKCATPKSLDQELSWKLGKL